MTDTTSESSTTSSTMSGGNRIFKEGHLLQKVFNIVMHERLITGIDESASVVDFQHPQELKKLLGLELGREGLLLEEVEQLLETTVRYSVKTQHPHFFKLFYHAIDEVGLAAAWLTDALNANQFSYETAPVFVLTELYVIEKMVKMFGWERGDGIFCPGGSISNMQAVMLARHQRDPAAKHKGLYGRKPPVIFTSDQSHYSFLKAGFCLGLGMDNVVEVKTDSEGRMCPTALKEAVASARERGADPFFVNATCGTTILGACDPLEQLADVCEEEGLWLHADACVGGVAMFSKSHKSFLSGIHRADSIAWNAHKLLCVPLQCSLLLTRHQDLLASCNSLPEPSPLPPHTLFHPRYDLADKSFQCNRKVDAFKLYLSLSLHGLQEIERRVDVAFDAARYLDAQVQRRAGFRPVVPAAHCTNVCFWFIPPRLRHQQESEEWWCAVGQVAVQVCERMTTSGRLMVSYQPIPAKGLVNFFRMVTHAHPPPLTTHMDFVLDEIERLGADL